MQFPNNQAADAFARGNVLAYKPGTYHQTALMAKIALCESE
jgi:hypothetical protein